MGGRQIDAGHGYQLGVVVNVRVPLPVRGSSTSAPLGVLRAPGAAFMATKAFQRPVLGELGAEGKQKARAAASSGACRSRAEVAVAGQSRLPRRWAEDNLRVVGNPSYSAGGRSYIVNAPREFWP